MATIAFDGCCGERPPICMPVMAWPWVLLARKQTKSARATLGRPCGRAGSAPPWLSIGSVSAVGTLSGRRPPRGRRPTTYLFEKFRVGGVSFISPIDDELDNYE